MSIAQWCSLSPPGNMVYKASPSEVKKLDIMHETTLPIREDIYLQVCSWWKSSCV